METAVLPAEDYSRGALRNRRMERAVTAAAGLFLERGIEDVKMTDIADASGVGVASLYRWFGTKTSVAAAALTFLWQDVRRLFSDVFDSKEFTSRPGVRQMRDLMRMYVVLFTAHKDLLRLVGEFDRLIITEQLSPQELADYEKSVIDFYPIFKRAYDKGLADGTVKEMGSIHDFYTAVSHALNCMCMKFIRGKLLPSEDFSHGEYELNLIIDMAVRYLSR